MLGLRRLQLRQLQAVARNASFARASSTSSTTPNTPVSDLPNPNVSLKHHGPSRLLTPSILSPVQRKQDTLPKPLASSSEKPTTLLSPTLHPSKRPALPRNVRSKLLRSQKPRPNKTKRFYAAVAEGKRPSRKKVKAIRRRLRMLPKKRADISLENPRKWNRPLAEGVLPAYDEALRVINKDSRMLKEEARELRDQIGHIGKVLEEKRKVLRDAETKENISAKENVKEVKVVGADGLEVTKREIVNEKVWNAKVEVDKAEKKLEGLREKLNILEVQSEINLPKVRWEISNAMADMRKPSHRHLVEQRWRQDGKLDLLMERVYQMNVVPDILPAIHPTVDLDVTVFLPSSRLLRSRKRVLLTEPGKFVLPHQTLKPPTLFPHAYHLDTRLYTLLMIDPDVPDPEQKSFTTYLHWLQPNIPISALTSSSLMSTGPLKGINNHTRYIPPHPQQGTKYHRYTILLVQQPPKDEVRGYSRNVEWEARKEVEKLVKVDGKEKGKEKELITTSKYLDIPVMPDSKRLGFDVRAFCKEWGLMLNGNYRLKAKEGEAEVEGEGVERRSGMFGGGGVHMFREVWDESVGSIHEVFFGKKEPRYGLPPKWDPYEDLKGRKRYVLQGQNQGVREQQGKEVLKA
ncbi:PEBP-like protein, partial [Dendrothele bispora CBS 962.96]